MKGHPIIVTDADMDRLSRLVQALKHSLFRDQLQLESLEHALESAEVTSSERIPRGVIRMNSRIGVLDFDTQKKALYMLVFPENADISTGRISVLAPVGIALLGRRQGDVIEAKVPGGARRLRVEWVSQRPANGKQATSARSIKSTRASFWSSDSKDDSSRLDPQCCYQPAGRPKAQWSCDPEH